MPNRFHLSLLIVSVAAALAGCAGKPTAIFGVDDPAAPAISVDGTTQHRIVIATNRERAEDPRILFNGERNSALNFAVADVSVPPTHTKGRIERPDILPPDPGQHFVIHDAAYLESPSAFVRTTEQELRRRAPSDRDVLIFVHGYNMDVSAAVLQLTQFVHDTGFKGVPVLFTWPSRGKLGDYVYDLNSALGSRDDLEEMGALLQRTNIRKADIVAHSMGNILTVETMRQLAMRGQFN
ncbi:MAG: alpha/beta hydrolase, partial [Pseudomonadota bacterium]